MTTIKIFLNVIGWLGAVIIGLSVPLIYTCAAPNVDMIGMCLGFFSWLAIAGVVLVLVGGFLSKWRYWWIVALVMGGVYIFASIPGLYAMEVREAGRCAEYNLKYTISYWFWIMIWLPGLAGIIGGILMRWLLRRQSV